LDEIEDALRLAGQERGSTPETAAKLAEMKDALRLGGLRTPET
jgi:mRNA interferase MazF